MLPRVWSSLWKVKIAADVRPRPRVSDGFLLSYVWRPRRLLTRVNLDVDLLLAGSEQDGLITKIQKSVSVHTEQRTREGDDQEAGDMIQGNRIVTGLVVMLEN